MLEQLSATLAACRSACAASGVSFHDQVHAVDFIESAALRLSEQGTFFAEPEPGYTHCIMNPPYRKIHSSSAWRQWLQQVGIETSNLYSAFLALAVRLLAPGGELVAIVPRSFCNGVYFRPFRHFFLREMALTHLHVFEARDQAFKDNQVLQENIILRAVKGGEQRSVAITASFDAEFEDLTWRQAEFAQVVRPADPDRFINIATTDSAQLVLDRLSVFTQFTGRLRTFRQHRAGGRFPSAGRSAPVARSRRASADLSGPLQPRLRELAEAHRQETQRHRRERRQPAMAHAERLVRAHAALQLQRGKTAHRGGHPRAAPCAGHTDRIREPPQRLPSGRAGSRPEHRAGTGALPELDARGSYIFASFPVTPR